MKFDLLKPLPSAAGAVSDGVHAPNPKTSRAGPAPQSTVARRSFIRPLVDSTCRGVVRIAALSQHIKGSKVRRRKRLSREVASGGHVPQNAES